jgi:hypothetical protein
MEDLPDLARLLRALDAPTPATNRIPPCPSPPGCQSGARHPRPWNVSPGCRTCPARPGASPAPATWPACCPRRPRSCSIPACAWSGMPPRRAGPALPTRTTTGCGRWIPRPAPAWRPGPRSGPDAGDGPPAALRGHFRLHGRRRRGRWPRPWCWRPPGLPSPRAAPVSPMPSAVPASCWNWRVGPGPGRQHGGPGKSLPLPGPGLPGRAPDIAGPLEAALARLEEPRCGAPQTLLIASDGEFGATAELAERLRRVKGALGLRVQGVLIGDRETIGFLELADAIHWVRDWRRFGGSEAHCDASSPVHDKSLTALYFPGALRSPENLATTVAGDAAARAVRYGAKQEGGVMSVAEELVGLLGTPGRPGRPAEGEGLASCRPWRGPPMRRTASSAPMELEDGALGPVPTCCWTIPWPGFTTPPERHALAGADPLFLARDFAGPYGIPPHPRLRRRQRPHPASCFDRAGFAPPAKPPIPSAGWTRGRARPSAWWATFQPLVPPAHLRRGGAAHRAGAASRTWPARSDGHRRHPGPPRSGRLRARCCAPAPCCSTTSAAPRCCAACRTGPPLRPRRPRRRLPARPPVRRRRVTVAGRHLDRPTGRASWRSWRPGNPGEISPGSSPSRPEAYPGFEALLERLG